MWALVFAIVTLVSARTVQLTVDCAGGICEKGIAVAGYTVHASEQGWIINGKKNPDVICQIGDVLVFNVNSQGHPFYIKSRPVRTVDFSLSDFTR